MLCLDNTDTLEGGASVASVIDYTVHGLVNNIFTVLADGQLSDTDPTVLYTAGTAISIVSITCVNTHSAAVTFNLYIDSANGGNPRRIIPKDLSLGIGYSMHYDGQRLTVLNANGAVVSLSLAISTDSGDISVTDDLSIVGGEGIDTSGAGSTVTIAGEDASATNKGVVELATSAEAITGADTDRVVTPAGAEAKLGTQTDGGVIVGAGGGAALEVVAPSALGKVLVDQGSGENPAYEYRPMQNLLTNSGFGVWSNSTLENYGSAIAEDDCADDDTGDWSQTGDSLAFDTDHYEWTCSSANKVCYITGASFTKGHLYKISVALKDGTASSQTLQLYMSDGDLQYSPTVTTTGSNVEHTFVFRVATTTANGGTGIKVTSNMAGNNIEFKNFTLYEVTPGCVAANALACDGWYKDATLEIYREPNGSNTKEGSYYSLKLSPTAENDYLRWPLATEYNDPAKVAQFAGRTVAFGMWIKSSTASDIRLRVADGVSYTDSSQHTGGGNWEWIEVSRAIDAAATTILLHVRHDNATPGTAYISQPMLIFGNSIGEGNYSRPPGEIIWFDQAVLSESLDNMSFSDVTDVELDAQVDSLGKIPAGLKAVHLVVVIKDSGSAASATYVYFRKDSSLLYQFAANLTGTPDDKAVFAAGEQAVQSDGTFDYTINASGANTFDMVACHYVGIELV